MRRIKRVNDKAKKSGRKRIIKVKGNSLLTAPSLFWAFYHRELDENKKSKVEQERVI